MSEKKKRNTVYAEAVKMQVLVRQKRAGGLLSDVVCAKYQANLCAHDLVIARYFILMRHFRKRCDVYLFFKARLTVTGLLPKLFIGKGRNKLGGPERKRSVKSGSGLFSRSPRETVQYSSTSCTILCTRCASLYMLPKFEACATLMP